jgi:peptidoglycan/LPS O-acetylase OafA/YrhL
MLGREASQGSRAIQYIPELDGLRGLAIILVVLFHARPEQASEFAPLPFLYTLLNLGPSGVDLFFVLSGFLITGILLSTKDASPRNYFWSFYARRILRIFPLYILAVAGFFYGLLPYLHSRGELLNVSRSEQFWFWTYLMNWRDAAGFRIINALGHFWSLGVEEQFYLIWPAVIFFFLCSSLLPCSVRRLGRIFACIARDPEHRQFHRPRTPQYMHSPRNHHSLGHSGSRCAHRRGGA